MDFRMAVMRDLPQLRAVYGDIIQNMNSNQIQIWDDRYPGDFFDEDIRKHRLYVLLNSHEIVSAFALCSQNPGGSSIQWQGDQRKALYLERLGVNVNYLRIGIASLMLEKAKEAARNSGAEFLRLFVVDTNKPAIRLYVKNGFTRRHGVYDEVIDDTLVLHEYGFEAAL